MSKRNWLNFIIHNLELQKQDPGERLKVMFEHLIYILFCYLQSHCRCCFIADYILTISLIRKKHCVLIFASIFFISLMTTVDFFGKTT